MLPFASRFRSDALKGTAVQPLRVDTFSLRTKSFTTPMSLKSKRAVTSKQISKFLSRLFSVRKLTRLKTTYAWDYRKVEEQVSRPQAGRRLDFHRNATATR
ncbi:unnamed protein product [Caenorhabditis auriculariae]|uniref:Uncharacterized protein n=1 Tax=Caenorhabditis auriculariae TaxID=2777116 RepID=A0A8S1HCH0_9PELO|nr:unnamed protein product [Caenorhabditis auriculariae]